MKLLLLRTATHATVLKPISLHHTSAHDEALPGCGPGSAGRIMLVVRHARFARFLKQCIVSRISHVAVMAHGGVMFSGRGSIPMLCPRASRQCSTAACTYRRAARLAGRLPGSRSASAWPGGRGVHPVHRGPLVMLLYICSYGQHASRRSTIHTPRQVLDPTSA